MYLNEDQVRSRLNLGKPVEQWLGISEEVEYTVLKWLRIDKKRNNTFTIAYFECFDESNEEFADIYEFSMLDPDENKYVEIVLKILCADSKNSIKIEYQFLHNLTDLVKYYSELDLDAYKMYSKYSREDIYNLTIEALPSYIRLILRENINAIILTNDDIPLFGYLNDFETIIYSDSVDEYLINEVNKNGLRIQEIYFSFEIEDE